MSTDFMMLANEFDKHSAAFKKRWGNVDAITGFYRQPKYDGVFAAFGQGMAVSRTMVEFKSVDHLIRHYDHPNHVIFGELWNPVLSFPEISGLARQHTPAQELAFVPFDMVTADEFDRGWSEVPYQDRLRTLQAVHKDATISLWSENFLGAASQAARSYVDQGGYDGIILRDPNGKWQRGRSRNGEIVKVKVKNSLDLPVVDIHMGVGEKTGRTVYTISVIYKDVCTTVGSGMPHDPTKLPDLGQIVEVEYLGITADGKLREPRFKGIRHDKMVGDV